MTKNSDDTRRYRNQRRAEQRLAAAYKAWQAATDGGRLPTPRHGQPGYLSRERLILLGLGWVGKP